MAIKLIIIFNILYLILSIPAYFISIKYNKLHWSDVITPFIISLIWVVTSSLSIGYSGHSSFNELIITFSLSYIIFNLKVFYIDKFFFNHLRNSLISFILSISLILFIRIILPYI